MITDEELNELFITYIEDLKTGILKKQLLPYPFYRTYFINNTTYKLYVSLYTTTRINGAKNSSIEQAEAAFKAAEEFVKKHPKATPILSIYCLTGKSIDPETKEEFEGLIAIGQTADGRCCLLWYKLIYKDDKITDFEIKTKHIPEKHVDDEDYTWDGNTNFFERVAELNK